MYFYFSSKTKVAVKLGGTFFSILGGDGVRVNIENPENTLVEILPLNGNADGINFLLDENFLCSPPSGVTVTDLRGAYSIFINLVQKTEGFKILLQEKLNSYLVTVFSDGNIKVSIDGVNGSFTDSLPFNISQVSVKEFIDNGENFIAFIQQSEEYFITVYRAVDHTFKKVFDGKFSSYSLSPVFTTTKNLCDVKKHQITCSYAFNEDRFVETDLKISHKKSPPYGGYIEKIIPYVFLEDLFVGENIDDYLSQNVLENKDKLKGYLGDFIGITPPKEHRTIDEIGLIYKRKDRVYYVDYFNFELENGKICNIKKCEH